MTSLDSGITYIHPLYYTTHTTHTEPSHVLPSSSEGKSPPLICILYTHIPYTQFSLRLTVHSSFQQMVVSIQKHVVCYATQDWGMFE